MGVMRGEKLTKEKKKTSGHPHGSNPAAVFSTRKKRKKKKKTEAEEEFKESFEHLPEKRKRIGTKTSPQRE